MTDDPYADTATPTQRARRDARTAIENYDAEVARGPFNRPESDRYALMYASPIVETLRTLYVVTAPPPRDVVIDVLQSVALSDSTGKINEYDAPALADRIERALTADGYAINVRSRK